MHLSLQEEDTVVMDTKELGTLAVAVAVVEQR